MSINSFFSNTVSVSRYSPTSTRKFTQKSEIFRHKPSHMVLSIIFLEDNHKIVLHLSILYEYQQFCSTPYLFLDTAATSTRKFTQKQEIFRHKTSYMVLSIIFLEDKHKMLLHLSIFYENQQFFNTVSVSRYSRPITVTRNPL